MSKLTERVVANQIQCHMIKNNLFPQLQSAYRSHHSTETALLKVKNDLLMNMNKGHVSLLVLLDLSAAFDTVDHKILLKTLQTKLGVCGSALSWFKSYLEGRSQRICIKETLSQSFDYYHALRFTTKFFLILIGLNCSRDAIVVARGATPSAHCVRRRKMPGWILPVREVFCKQTIILVGFSSGFVSFDTFRFSSPSSEIN